MWGLEIKVKISFILSYSKANGKKILTSRVKQSNLPYATTQKPKATSKT